MGVVYMKKASAKLRRKIKIKFCRELNRLDAKFSSKNSNSRGRKK